MNNLENIRREYSLHVLDESAVHLNPVEQFSIWMNEALNTEEAEPTAMTLSTISPENKPSSRIVLLKKYSEQGFDFFTNYNSKKGQHIENNPNISLLFFWPKIEREVRIEGKAVKISREESEAYFISRPRESQIAAWTSPQSSRVPNRKTLKDWYEELESIHENKDVKCPPHWGGYRLVPELFEFWQGRESRLHDRIEYFITENNWGIRRIAP